MKIATGNAHDAESRKTGWFLGFGEWTQSEQSGLLFVPKEQAVFGLCVKWYRHPSGDDSGESKPISAGRTISILVSEGSEFRIDFSGSPGFGKDAQTVILKRHGDFAVWGDGIYHRWHCIRDATVLTVRWRSEDDVNPAFDNEE